jgi:hypothetical protein
MTLLDEPATPRPPRRSWRELPATPPVGDPLPPPDPSTFVAPVAPDEADPSVGPAGGERRPHRGRRVLLGGVLAAALSGGTAVAISALSGDDRATTPTVPPSQAGSPAAVAAALGPAVVQIELGGGLEAGGGVGSGVIYDPAGLVLTAHHVVATADEVVVRTADDRALPGRVVGRAPERDLAVVALDGASDLVAAPIAEPGSVEVGETAIALGSPFGFQASVTAGIISGLDRELDTPAGTLSGLIQTDAPINPGNSGGPLADAAARVIGINTAIASMSGGNDGVGFAVPVEDAADLLAEVTANGGVDAPTVPAPESGGGLLDSIPGLDDLLPGLGDALPDLGDLPGLDDLLGDMFGSEGIPDTLLQLLQELFGDALGLGGS